MQQAVGSGWCWCGELGAHTRGERASRLAAGAARRRCPPAAPPLPRSPLPPRIVRPGRSTLLPGPNAPHAGTLPALQHAPPRSPSTTRLLRATGACAMLSRCSAAVTPRKPLLALPNTWAVGLSCRAAMLGCVSPPPGHSHATRGVQGWCRGNARCTRGVRWDIQPFSRFPPARPRGRGPAGLLRPWAPLWQIG